jgi:DNA polymerase-3 subunit gamma/tau
MRALSGAVRENRLAHAFLFCGPRGTGKTSTARILAKMVNCEKGGDHGTDDPCGECWQCLAIREGQHLDVIEIDAASHGGVEDARELREKAPTAPVQGREKVYIIDEAQRLSAPAFDALLKVFEEPPPGVRFVLCTTEPHKMPATIVGRCQRFDFRRVSSDVLVGHLMKVAKEEGVKLSEATAESIARHAEGSVRDALSTLDQAAVLGAGKVGDDVLEQLLGAPPSEVQYRIADAVAIGDTKSIFEIVNRLVQEGQDLRHITSEALEHFRSLLLVQVAPAGDLLLDVTDDENARMRAQSAKFSAGEISRVISLLLAAQADMRWTTSPRLTFELALIRAAMPETDATPHALVSRIERLERLAGVDGAAPATGPPAPAPAPEPVPESTARTESADPDGESVAGLAGQPRMRAHAGGSADVDVFRRSWPDIVSRLREARQMILAANLESVTPLAFDGETLELIFPPDRRYAVKKVEEREKELQAVMSELIGVTPTIRCIIRESNVALEPEEDEPLSDAEALARLQDELQAKPAED